MPKQRPSDPYRLLGTFIASERHRAGLTQHDVAAALGQRPSWVRRVERGSSRQRVDVVELLVLADTVGFDPDKALQRLRWRRSRPRSPRVKADRQKAAPKA
jgi:transcriptional regulator with XRE-family HTH domain